MSRVQYVYGPALDAPDQIFNLITYINDAFYILNYDPGLNPGELESVDEPYFGIIEREPIGERIQFKLTKEEDYFELKTVSNSDYNSLSLTEGVNGLARLISGQPGIFNYQYETNTNESIDLFTGYPLSIIVNGSNLLFRDNS